MFLLIFLLTFSYYSEGIIEVYSLASDIEEHSPEQGSDYTTPSSDDSTELLLQCLGESPNLGAGFRHRRSRSSPHSSKRRNDAHPPPGKNGPRTRFLIPRSRSSSPAILGGHDLLYVGEEAVAPHPHERMSMLALGKSNDSVRSNIRPRSSAVGPPRAGSTSGTPASSSRAGPPPDRRPGLVSRVVRWPLGLMGGVARTSFETDVWKRVLTTGGLDAGQDFDTADREEALYRAMKTVAPEFARSSWKIVLLALEDAKAEIAGWVGMEWDGGPAQEERRIQEGEPLQVESTSYSSVHDVEDHDVDSTKNFWQPLLRAIYARLVNEVTRMVSSFATTTQDKISSTTQLLARSIRTSTTTALANLGPTALVNFVTAAISRTIQLYGTIFRFLVQRGGLPAAKGLVRFLEWTCCEDYHGGLPREESDAFFSSVEDVADGSESDQASSEQPSPTAEGPASEQPSPTAEGAASEQPSPTAEGAASEQPSPTVRYHLLNHS